MSKRYVFFDILAIFTFFIIPILATANVLFSPKTFAGNDIIDQFIPWRFFLTEQILKLHKIPLWNPYTFNGTPFLGNIQNGIFYPITYLLLFNKYFMFKLLYIINIFILAVGLYYFLLEFNISRIASFFLSFWIVTVYQTWQGSLAIIQSFSWLPFSLLFFKKLMEGKILFLGLCTFTFYLQFTGGYPQALFVTLIACSIVMLYSIVKHYKNRSRSILNILILSATSLLLLLLLSGVQLLPAIELYFNSNRSLASEEITTTALNEVFNPYVALLTLLPGLLSKKLIYNTYLAGNFAQLFIIFLFLCSFFKARFKTLPYKGLLLTFFIISLSLSLGKLNPINRFLFYLPGFSFFRHGGTYFVISVLVYFIVAAHGFDIIINHREQRRFYIVATGIFLLLSFSLIYSFINKVASVKIIFTTFLLNTIILIIFLLCVTFKKLRKIALYLLMTFILCDQLIYLHGQSIPSNYYEEIIFKDKIFSILKEKINRPGRIILTDRLVHPNENMLYGFETADGYDPIIVKYYAEFLKDAGIINQIGNFAYFYFQDYRSNIADIVNIKYIISPRPLFENKLKIISRYNDYFLYENLSANSRAYFAVKIEYCDTRMMVKNMLATDYVNEKVVFSDEKIEETLYKNDLENNFSDIKFLEYSNEKIKISVRNNSEGFLVLADTFYPGWKAYVNGKESRILRANYFMRAVRVPAGENEVVFIYDPWTFKVGGVLSLIGLFATFTLLIFHKRISKWLFSLRSGRVT